MFRVIALVLAISSCLHSGVRATGPSKPKAKPKAVGIAYTPGYWNSTCRYHALDVPAFDFFAGQDTGMDNSLFPLESNEITAKFKYALQSCFGPSEKYNDKLVIKGSKLPCKYSYNKRFNIDYWEEQPCLPTLLANCYCYGLNRYKAGFCIPGGPQNQARETWSCEILKAGIKRDGGKEVTYATVISKKPQGTHYIAAGIPPNTSAKGSDDFHIWRYDSNRAWSWKSGFTFVRNSYKNGTLVRDIRDPNIRKLFPQLCGFFDVNAKTHRLHALSLTNAERQSNSNIPGRYQAWRASKKFHTKVTPQPRWSAGWYKQYKAAFVDQSLGDVAVKISTAARKRTGYSFVRMSTVKKTVVRRRTYSRGTSGTLGK